MKHAEESVGERLGAFVASLGAILENDAQRESFAAYVLGLLSDGERKSMEPIAARVCPDPERVDATHQKLQHFISHARWSDRAIRRHAVSYGLNEMLKHSPVQAWIIDDTGMLKQGRHSVGVQRQYTGSAGKIANCQVVPTLSVSTAREHIPIDIQLYLPETWTADRARRKKAKIPRDVKFKTKTQIAIEMLEAAIADGIPRGVLLADAFYGRSGPFRARARELGLEFIVAIDSDTLVHPVVEGRLSRKKRIRADEYAAQLVHRAVTWREGSKHRLSGQFAFALVKTDKNSEVLVFICERQKGDEKAKFYLGTSDRQLSKTQMIRLLKDRWRTERIYQDLKGELGFDHFEGRTYPGWQHHVSVVLCGFAFLAAERAHRSFPPSADPACSHCSLTRAAGTPLSGFADHGSGPARTANRRLDSAMPVLSSNTATLPHASRFQETFS